MDWRCAAVVAFIIPVAAQVSEIPIDRLKPDATLAVELTRGAHVSADAVWIPAATQPAIVRVDAKNNTPDKPITLETPACGTVETPGAALWMTACDRRSLARLDVTHGNVSAPMPLALAAPEGAVAFAGQSLWAITGARGVVTRVDPVTRHPVAEIYVAPGPAAIASGEDAVWVASEEGGVLTRVNPQTNVVVEIIDVGPRPGALAIGEGAVWVLNRGDGSVSRVDTKTNKVIHTIAVGESVASGTIATGEGAVWLSARGLPLVRIDPRTNRVTHRFSGDGGGAVMVGHGSVWLNVSPKTTWRIDPKLVAATRP